MEHKAIRDEWTRDARFERWPERVLLLYEGDHFGGDFGLSFADGLRDQGCEVELLSRGEPWNQAFDLVLGYGPQVGSIQPAARQLLAQPRQQRPILVWWLTEGIPDPRLPLGFVKIAAKLLVVMDHWAARSPAGQDLLARLHLDDIWSRGHRLRILGELHWIQSQGVLDVLAVTSASRAAYLRRCGLQPITVPLGYHPIYGTDLGLQRDVDVCFLGSTDSGRRCLFWSGFSKSLRVGELRFRSRLICTVRTARAF